MRTIIIVINNAVVKNFAITANELAINYIYFEYMLIGRFYTVANNFSVNFTPISVEDGFLHIEVLY
jgi:hypothetical protein